MIVIVGALVSNNLHDLDQFQKICLTFVQF